MYPKTKGGYEMSETITDSGLVDQIKEVWKLYKNDEFPIAGDYYYQLIGKSIYGKQIIKIQLNHLPDEVRWELNRTPVKNIKSIFYRAIKEIFQEKAGKKLTNLADTETRIRVMLV